MTTQDLQSIPDISRMTLPCFYCQQDCTLFMRTQDEVKMRGHCERHLHKIYCSSDPQTGVQTSTYYITYQERSYRIKCYKLKETASWELTAYVCSDRVWQWKLIIRLDFLPAHITPDNIDKKLPTLLLFS